MKRTLPDLHPMVMAIYGLACLKHAGQTRRDGETPYVEHLHDLLRISKTSDALKQAIIIGHDLFEDTDCTEDELRATLVGFSAHDIERIVGSIYTLTKRKGETYPAFIDRIKTSVFAYLVIEVKRWDIAANVADNPTPKQLAKYGAALIQLST